MASKRQLNGPTFGGAWTEEKLQRLRKYLQAYSKIFSTNPKAKHYSTIYVDGFASAGYREEPRVEPSLSNSPAALFPEQADKGQQLIFKGSPRIALETEPPFDHFIFVEMDLERCRELERLRGDFPQRDIQIVNAEANKYLQEWSQTLDRNRFRAVVFLDPFGMQVEWQTLVELAKTGAVDLWLLFPLGMAVIRMLTKNEPPPEPWSQSLTRLWGTDSWKEEFYRTNPQLTLSGESRTIRAADFEKITAYFIERLKSIFPAVAENPLHLYNRGVPLYLLMFAAANKEKAALANKIAQNILGR